MSSPELENLVESGLLKREPTSKPEIEALLHSGQARLKDARNDSLELESRFDLAYNAAHSYALAALRLQGYRPDKRYVVFQLLPYTAGAETATWRLLDKVHGQRNLIEYEGGGHIDDRIVEDLVAAATVIETKVMALPR